MLSFEEEEMIKVLDRINNTKETDNMFTATYYYNSEVRPKMPEPLVYQVRVEDSDGDEYCDDIGDVDFTKAKFGSEAEAIKEFEAALAREDDPSVCFPPVKATVLKRCWVTKIEEQKVTTTKLVNRRPY